MTFENKTTKYWEFKKPRENGCLTTEITVELRDNEDCLGAYADDSYYYGNLTKEESIELARAVLEKLDPAALSPGTPVRVVDGPMCGSHGVVLGTVRESGYVILKCHDGILLQPPQFVRVEL